MFDPTRPHAAVAALLLALAVAPLGCKAPQAAAAEAPVVDAEKEKEGDSHGGGDKGDKKESKDAKEGKDHHARAGHGHEGHAKKFTVPFAAEADKDDPLALTRTFFHGVFTDNAAYARTHDPAFFKAFAGSQKPRATVVTCSDSRVQSPAYDATPENDDFTIRNIGNQVANSEGSVEYGVHHLKTPVLFVLGHTGCGAVKAAMGDYGKESDAIKHELDAIKVAKRKEGVKDDDPAAWVDGVVQNVNDQVAAALAKFDDEVASGALTIVGGVYDFRNDMKAGTGKIVLVNVNGNRDAAKLQAFERGVLGLVGPDPHAGDGARAKDTVEIKDIKDLRDALRDAKAQPQPMAAKEPKAPAKEAHGSAH